MEKNKKSDSFITTTLGENKDYSKECSLVAASVFNKFEIFSEKEFLQFATSRGIPKDIFKEFFVGWVEKMEEVGFLSEVKPSIYDYKMWKRNK